MVLQVLLDMPRVHGPDSNIPGPFLRVEFAMNTLRDEEMDPFGQRACLPSACYKVAGPQAQCPTLVMQPTACAGLTGPLRFVPVGQGKPTQMLMLLMLLSNKAFCL